MDLREIATAIALTKAAQPALDALGHGIGDLVSHESADLRNAATSVGKALLDLKGGLTALESAVKAGIASKQPSV